MADFLTLDIKKFQDQLLLFISAYYDLLVKAYDEDKNNKGDRGKFEKLVELSKDSEKWREQIIKLFMKYYDKKENDYSPAIIERFHSLRDYLLEDIEKGKYVEFYMIVDICQFLYETYFNITEKNKKAKSKNIRHIEKHISRCLYKEIIDLRNQLSHDEDPELEYVLRFYENQYFFIKIIKPENYGTDLLTDYAKKDIQFNIHIYLEKNLNNVKSFDLNPLCEEIDKLERKLKLEKRKKYNLYDENDFICLGNKTKEEIHRLIYGFPEKLPDFVFEIEKKNKESKEDEEVSRNDENDEEEENENNKGKDMTLNISRNSFSETSIKGSSYGENSGRSSIDESEKNTIEGNAIKENSEVANSKIEESFSKSSIKEKTDIQDRI